MAHYHTEFYTIVNTRLTGDATLAALIDGVFSVEAPDSAASYVGIQIQSTGRESNAFRTLGRDILCALTIVVPRNLTAEGYVTRMGKIMERVEGNWYAKSFGVAPDFGLERWQGTLTGWDITPLRFVESIDVSDANVYAIGMTFECEITKEAI